MNTDIPYVEPQCPIARIREALFEVEALWKEAREAATYAEKESSAMQSRIQEMQGDQDRLKLFLELETSRRQKLHALVCEMQAAIKWAAKEVKK